MVGRHKLFIRNRHHNWEILGGLEMGTWFQSRPGLRVRHWMGRGGGHRARPTSSNRPRATQISQPSEVSFSRAFRQLRGRGGDKQRPLTEQVHQSHPKAGLSVTSTAWCSTTHRICVNTYQHSRRALAGGRRGFLGGFSLCHDSGFNSTTGASGGQAGSVVMQMRAPPVVPARITLEISKHGRLELIPSRYGPPAAQRTDFSTGSG